MELTYKELQHMLTASAVKALEAVGAVKPISQTEGIRRFGAWFKMRTADGTIQPVHVGEGKSGKKSYRFSDILAAQEADMRLARIQREGIDRI